MTLVDLEDLRAAQRRIAGTAVRTPLLPCPWAEDGGRRLWLKPESLQPTGAFKIRGATNRLAALTDEERARGVVAQSSGNHAQAVAYAAQRLGIKAVIVMPDTSPAVKIENTRSFGAEVVIVPAEQRDTVPAELAAAHGYVWVPPYDDPYIVAGQGTVGLEIAEDAPDELDTVLVPVSGGGLISGTAAALKLACPGVRVVGVEPELAADAQQSLREGVRTAWPVADTYRTIADGLRTPSVGVLPFEHITAYVDDIVTVTEDEIRATVARLARRGRLVAEPSGAVAPAAYFHHADELGGRVFAAVVSGGNLDPALLAELLAA
ncbi:threonine/serine dehydratase [Kitasatospora sp. YST-16]|uniref:threonine ammonia-lyase n=1 Tax=unclassified Kitasatospora TaxID=2633591 RepID=UPI0004C43272|nr:MULTISPECIES: threonine/serine dehydratase [unclassified Kitasatospora]WAL72347.1 threonine/serine dehydratase [Kitasatospora sp. YST-16]WNW38395.1 threonine/serine dehydratase [Streptomyces sp. Li-HN-5-13]